MQKEVITRIQYPGVYVLEAPTGMGKTEAALYAAYKLMVSEKARGIYFGLPTRLTSDRIHVRVNEFLQQICQDNRSARLAHGNAWLSRLLLTNGPTDYRSDDNAEAWFNPLKRALLYPFAVGTIDQALLGVLNVKHFFLRLFGLAGKVVVLDEIHSYDVFTGTHLDTLVNILQQLGCTVIILSATLTSRRRAELIGGKNISLSEEYPLLTTSEGTAYPSPPPPEKKIYVEMCHWSDLNVAESAIEAASQGANVLCVANTVARAQDWYRTIKSEMMAGDFSVGLLHSKFIGADRADKESYWMECLGKEGARPQGTVLVATQVVEQSVDIDADFLITELAPTDMLIQRLGRLWRHDRTARPINHPTVAIIADELPNDADPEQLRKALGMVNTFVYSPYILCRSYDTWQKYDKQFISFPRQVRDLLQATYEVCSEEPTGWVKLREEQTEQETKLRRSANAVQTGNAGIPVGRDDEQAATRYNDRPMQEVLLVENIDDRGNEGALTLLSGEQVQLSAFQRDIHASALIRNNILSIPMYELSNTSSPPNWLMKNLNSNTILLIRGEDGILYQEQSNTGLSYDNEKGLFRLLSSSSSKRLDNDSFTDIFTPYSDYDHGIEGYLYESGDW